MADETSENLLRISKLVHLLSETLRIFSDNDPAGDGRVSRLTEMSQQMERMAAELKTIAESRESETNGS